MDAAVASCKCSFPAWADTSVLSRQQVLLRYQQLIKENLVRNLNDTVFQTLVYSRLVTPTEALLAALPHCPVQRDVDHGSLSHIISSSFVFPLLPEN